MEMIRKKYDEFSKCVGRFVIGHDDAVRQLFVALIADGHVLLEGIPGVAKTLLAKTLAKSLALEFKRIQFTPDLMPSDVLGTNVFNFELKEFVLVKGPIFSSILLCDELNRTPPKTQAALLEAMQEKQVSIDGKTHVLPDTFFVMATENPLEFEGTYPLPEAQLDRFLMKILLHNSDEACMRQILKQYIQERFSLNEELERLVPIFGQGELSELRQFVLSVRVDDKVVDFVAKIQAESHSLPGLVTGMSPRAGILLLRAGQAQAACLGREFVTPDDIRGVSRPLLRHRFIIKPDLEYEGITPEQVVDQLFDRVPVPK